MEKRYIIGLDAGTTSVRSVVYDIKAHKIVCMKRAPITQFYPHKGWVEQDAEEIYFMLKRTMEEAIQELDKPLSAYIGVGLTNQRETVVAFNHESGKPAMKAIVWQDRRTNDFIQGIPTKIKNTIKSKTGLIPDAYFSASKIKWMLENSKRVSDLADSNKLRVGTLDSYLAYKFTGNFVSDTSNASRTMLFNLETLDWDKDLLKYFGIKKDFLPKIVSSSQNIGMIEEFNLPLLSIIGDQQSSLFGNGCIYQGMAKNTYGTGCFVLMNIGNTPAQSDNMLTTIAYTINGKTTYALEGSVFSACSALNWAMEKFDIDEDFDLLDKKISSLQNNHGVYFVPAFSGLGAPYWKPNATATLTGVTLDTSKYTLLRSVYESMCYNTKAIIDEMTQTTHTPLLELRVDGGGSKSSFLRQFQADILCTNIMSGDSSEATVLGAIFMAGLTAGVFTIDDIKKLTTPTKKRSPKMDKNEINTLYSGWKQAVLKSINN